MQRGNREYKTSTLIGWENKMEKAKTNKKL